MSRGKQISKRRIMPDAKYQSELLAKFVNTVMKGGKKTTAQAIVYGMLDILKEKKQENPLTFFEKAIDAIRPQLEVRSRRVGGANYQIPLPVSASRQNALAFRWVIEAAQARKGHSMKEKLAQEFIDAMEGLGGAMKKKADVHRMAEANKAFAHFARHLR
ncbi:MAG TPA: 30S ribosomal protein S7 [Candidatus Kapabacteria bacterium]|nr:30S ribosomal protein S7 [Candidatus Kapabacteria bacterium]